MFDDNTATLEEADTTPQIFTGQTTREALNQVRRALGADAIIIRQEETARGVTIHAALELPTPATPSAASEAAPFTESGAASATASAADAVSNDGVEAQWAPVPPEAPIDLSADTQTGAEPIGELTRRLSEAGYAPHIIEDLPFARSLQEFREQLIERLDFIEGGAASLQGVYRFVGAAGSGKTTLLIKTLISWVERHGATGVAVVSTDQDKLGAAEGLHLACQMLNVDIHEVATTGLQHTLQQLSGRSLVLIDTPALEANRHSATARIPGVQNVWVMSVLHNLANIHRELSWHVQKPACIALAHMDYLLGPDTWLNHIYRLRLPLLCGNHDQDMGRVTDLSPSVLFERLFSASDVAAGQASVNNLTVEV